MPGLPGGGNPTRFPGCPLCFVISYQKSPFLTTRGRRRAGGETPAGFRIARPPPGAGRVPYPIIASANTLAVHTITPAIVIRTVCCHMVSIPYSGRCWVERWTDTTPRAVMGVTGKFYSGGRGKKEKTGPAREPVRQPCLFADAEGAEDEIQLLPQRRQRPRL